MKHSQLHLDNQICHRLYMAANSITRRYRESLATLNLTYPQYVVMMALWEKDEITIAELVDKTAIDGSAMTQILKKMTDKALLAIVKDEHDKRKRLVKLRSHGQQLQDLAADIPAQIRCQIPHLTDDEAQQLMHLLDKVVQDLN
ncbi:MarR family winged helix-turn-helix transcriptional regulator [Vibrio aphrogenes]|uniref:MarR family winged helix-turn-helix transcriptional regulator n=1 Tax=Vibrio aphrogenes TaxID=1891186 RepID=UPI000B355029|nr:MarR family transcriptional regulator [Vibrio aphrogenes]